MPTTPLIRSTPGLIFALVGLLLLAVLGFSVYSLSQNRLLYGILAALSAWLLITWLSLRVAILEEGLEIRSLWGSRQLAWEHMAALSPAIGSALMQLNHFKKGQSLLLLLPFHNREDLLKEIINSSWRANPNVRLASSLTRRYGFPPYSRKSKRGN